jgi:polysaccharide export outer membrane protein
LFLFSHPLRGIAICAAFCLAAMQPVALMAQTPGEYRVNAGDELEVFVWGEERLQRPVRVLPDGTFAFPLAGTIVAAGKTAPEIASAISERIKDNYRKVVPDVTVAVRDTSGSRFYVVGKVRTPGGYAIGRTVNVVQALSLAGGTAEFADVDNAVILRQTPTGQSVERVRLSEVLKGSRSLSNGPQASPLPTLGSGDVLVIP